MKRLFFKKKEDSKNYESTDVKDKNERSENQSEEFIRDEMSKLNGLREAMPYPYYIRDMDFNVIEFSPKMEEMTGYKFEEVKKIKCYDALRTSICGENCVVQKHIKNSKEAVRDVYVKIKDRHGNTIPTLISYIPYFDEKNEVIGAIEIIRDITGEKTLIDQLDDNSSHLSSISQELAASSEETLAMSNETLNTIEMQAKKLIDCRKEAKITDEKADNIIKDSNIIKSSVEELNESMNVTMDGMKNLSNKTSIISNIVESIVGIASQTNLLALNAAIEAARAGEHGKGFAVVADEIRKLAENSALFSKNIQESLSEIDTLVNTVTIRTSKTNEKLKESENIIASTINQLNDIKDSVDKLNLLIEESMKQGEVTIEISNNQNNAMEDVAKVSTQLAEIAQVLHNEVAKLAEENHLK